MQDVLVSYEAFDGHSHDWESMLYCFPLRQVSQSFDDWLKKLGKLQEMHLVGVVK